MTEAAAEDTGTQVQETAETPAEKAAAKTGDFIIDTSAKIKLLTKTQSFNRADKLVGMTGESDFELGGILKHIFDMGWHEGYPSFKDLVSSRFGFADRKARYLMSINSNLTEKHIPWDKVKGLGWTKLARLADANVLTLESVDDWVAKAESVTVAELEALLKAGTDIGDGSPSTKTTSDTVVIRFKLKNDQAETVQSALQKAMSEAKTEFSNVALEMICSGYLSGSNSVPQSLDDVLKSSDFSDVLAALDKAFPDVTLTVIVPATDTATAPAEAA